MKRVLLVFSAGYPQDGSHGCRTSFVQQEYDGAVRERTRDLRLLRILPPAHEVIQAEKTIRGLDIKTPSMAMRSGLER